MNSVNLVGRLTRDVEFRTTPTGTAVANFGVAIQRDFKNAAGTYDADFFNVVAWRQSAEFAQKYFSKGKMIAITGRLQSRKWTDEAGANRTAVEIVAEQLGFCGDSKTNTAAQSPVPVSTPAQAAKPAAENPTATDFAAADEDYPF